MPYKDYGADNIRVAVAFYCERRRILLNPVPKLFHQYPVVFSVCRASSGVCVTSEIYPCVLDLYYPDLLSHIGDKEYSSW